MFVHRNGRPQPPALWHIAKAEPCDLGRSAADKLLAHEANRAARDRREADDSFT
jgi:hypothetical protein